MKTWLKHHPTWSRTFYRGMMLSPEEKFVTFPHCCCRFLLVLCWLQDQWTGNCLPAACTQKCDSAVDVVLRIRLVYVPLCVLFHSDAYYSFIVYYCPCFPLLPKYCSVLCNRCLCLRQLLHFYLSSLLLQLSLNSFQSPHTHTHTHTLTHTRTHKNLYAQTLTVYIQYI